MYKFFPSSFYDDKKFVSNRINDYINNLIFNDAKYVGLF